MVRGQLGPVQRTQGGARHIRLADHHLPTVHCNCHMKCIAKMYSTSHHLPIVRTQKNCTVIEQQYFQGQFLRLGRQPNPMRWNQAKEFKNNIGLKVHIKVAPPKCVVWTCWYDKHTVLNTVISIFC